MEVQGLTDARAIQRPKSQQNDSHFHGSNQRSIFGGMPSGVLEWWLVHATHDKTPHMGDRQIVAPNHREIILWDFMRLPGSISMFGFSVWL